MRYGGKIGKMDRKVLSNIGCIATCEREGKGKLREKEDRGTREMGYKEGIGMERNMKDRDGGRKKVREER